MTCTQSFIKFIINVRKGKGGWRGDGGEAEGHPIWKFPIETLPVPYVTGLFTHGQFAQIGLPKVRLG